MAKDPYRYFRIEAQDLLEGLSRGVLDLEKARDPELVRRLLRQAHTLKGAARVVKQAQIGELAHRLEDLLEPLRGGDGPAPREAIDGGLALLDQIRALLAALGAPAPAEAAPAAAAGPIPDEARPSVRVGIEEMDALLEYVSEASAAAARLQRDLAALDDARARAAALVNELRRGGDGAAGRTRLLGDAEALAVAVNAARRAVLGHAEQAARELAELREAAVALRLVSADSLVADVERAVRDAARSLGKQVAFRATGADTRIDAHVLSGLRTALLHVARNAVAHGIEDDAARARAGKPPAGAVEIAIARRGHRVAITCRDDGRGLDVDAVRRSAAARGLVSEAAARAMALDELVPLLLRGGVSTARGVTEVSGRGVGLDVVRETMERLEGGVNIRTEPGRGTTVELTAPISLSSMPALALESEGAVVLLPLDAVRGAVRLGPDDVSRSAGGERVVVDGDVIPFLPLARALRGAGRGRGRGGGRTAVVIEAGGGRTALGVDRLAGVRNIVMRGIPAHAAADPVVAGAAFGDDGAPQLVLAAAALVEAAASAIPADEPAPAPPPPLLVIDDSLTTRMLEKSILESAGYEVNLAVSAEDALHKARQRRYGAFIVNVEMPGMSGFDFIATARADVELRDVPSILVTSRSDPDDKRRGKQVGARAYIVKGEFDQQSLLEAIRRLVGTP